MKRAAVALLVLIAIVLTACDGLPQPGAGDSNTTTLTPTTTGESTTTEVTTPPTLPPSAPSGLCKSYEAPIVTGTIGNEEATEISGVVSSRAHPDVLWMLNDSGGGPFVYAASVSGEHEGTFEIDTSTFDWEDIAIGPGPDPDLDYLYLGDIGDNLHFRPYATVQRIAEPTPDADGAFVAGVEVFNLVYPEPGPDAEAMFVDPVTGDLIIATKPNGGGGESEIYKAGADQLVDGATIDLTLIASFPLDDGVFVTAADIDATGAAIAFRGYNEVWVWRRTDLDLSKTFATEPCSAPSTAEVQGEAITFAADGLSYYTISEGSSPDINYVFSIFD